MFQMFYIFSNQVFQPNGISAADPADNIEFLGRTVRDYVRQVKVVSAPQVDKKRPALVGVILGFHPNRLGVTGEIKTVLKLGADKTLVVVAGRIYQVPQNLLLAPLSLRKRLDGILLLHCTELVVLALLNTQNDFTKIERHISSPVID
jgi:hypothetical protein